MEVFFLYMMLQTRLRFTKKNAPDRGAMLTFMVLDGAVMPSVCMIYFLTGGRIILNVVPDPGTLFRSMRPLCCAAI